MEKMLEYVALNVVLDKEDVEFIKTALKRQSGMGIGKAKDLLKTLDRVSSLQTERVGCWKTYDEGELSDPDWSYIECSCCGNDIANGKDRFLILDYVFGINGRDFPCFCFHCGARMGVALRPSEYLRLLKSPLSTLDENEGIDKLITILSKYSPEYDFSGDLEAIICSYEQDKGQENYPLFNEKGEVVYG